MKQFETGRKYSQVPCIRRVGRPKKFETVEELEEAIQKYFDSCFVKVQRRELVRAKDETEGDEAGDEISENQYVYVDVLDDAGVPIREQIKPFTITGLANALDTTRDLLLDYEKDPSNAEFSDTVKRAKAFIHQYAEEYLFEGKNQTGGIFNLKNNWNWVDRTETGLDLKGGKISAEAVAAKADDILKTDTSESGESA